MSRAIPPLPQYASMAWCSVKAQGQLYNIFKIIKNMWNYVICGNELWACQCYRLGLLAASTPERWKKIDNNRQEMDK
jgi:hypothetical protein